MHEKEWRVKGCMRRDRVTQHVISSTETSLCNVKSA